MMPTQKILFPIIFFATLFLIACGSNQKQFDASGTFEAVETIISSEAQGKIINLEFEEGQHLDSAQKVGQIDSTQLHLKRKQLLAQIQLLNSKKPHIKTQLAPLQEQLQSAQKDELRFQNLVQSDAAASKTLDDIQTKIQVLQKQILAKKSALNIARSSIDKNIATLHVQLEQIQDQIQKCQIINPLAGTVLTKYAETYELTAPGKPLYKIANLSEIILRAYITGDQLAQVKLGQKVSIYTDKNKDEYEQSSGIISWISAKAEFTPKTIQTKKERANLVYAIKVRVKNKGQFKIGMVGEIKLNSK